MLKVDMSVKTADEARELVESWFAVVHHEVGTSYRAPTGEPYQIIMSGGPKEEGECIPALYASPELAVQEWCKSVLDYLGDRPGTLYWREPPILEKITFLSENYHEWPTEMREVYGKRTYWVVYSRLLVSDAPIKRAAA